MSGSIVIDKVVIRQDQHGRYCLNDLHRAAGGLHKHRPSDFLANQKTKEFETAINAKSPKSDLEQNQAVVTLHGGDNRGTYVVKPLVYDYAAWVSPDFKLKVYEVFDAVVTGKYDGGAHRSLPDIGTDPLAAAVELARSVLLFKERADAAEARALSAEAREAALVPHATLGKLMTPPGSVWTMKEAWQRIFQQFIPKMQDFFEQLENWGWINPNHDIAYSEFRANNPDAVAKGHGFFWPVPGVRHNSPSGEPRKTCTYKLVPAGLREIAMRLDRKHGGDARRMAVENEIAAAKNVTSPQSVGPIPKALPPPVAQEELFTAVERQPARQPTPKEREFFATLKDRPGPKKRN